MCAGENTELLRDSCQSVLSRERFRPLEPESSFTGFESLQDEWNLKLDRCMGVYDTIRAVPLHVQIFNLTYSSPMNLSAAMTETAIDPRSTRAFVRRTNIQRTFRPFLGYWLEG
jgi:hypothetical protein